MNKYYNYDVMLAQPEINYPNNENLPPQAREILEQLHVGKIVELPVVRISLVDPSSPIGYARVTATAEIPLQEDEDGNASTIHFYIRGTDTDPLNGPVEYLTVTTTRPYAGNPPNARFPHEVDPEQPMFMKPVKASLGEGVIGNLVLSGGTLQEIVAARMGMYRLPGIMTLTPPQPAVV